MLSSIYTISALSITFKYLGIYISFVCDFAAFIVNIFCIGLPIFVFWTMCSRELWIYMREKTLLKILFWPLSLLCAPFFILYIASKHVMYKFLHRRAKKKNKYRAQLQKSEYFWGISRTAEAALESCGQLILQIWMLSSNFDSLRNDSFMVLVDKTYDGLVFFLSFGVKDASDIGKGPIWVIACYRV